MPEGFLHDIYCSPLAQHVTSKTKAHACHHCRHPFNTENLDYIHCKQCHKLQHSHYNQQSCLDTKHMASRVNIYSLKITSIYFMQLTLMLKILVSNSIVLFSIWQKVILSIYSIFFLVVIKSGFQLLIETFLIIQVKRLIKL